MNRAQHIVSDQRIAKNALLLYARTFIVLCISLYISRLVLDALGAVNVGIYNVVGGIVTLMAFFQTALIKSTGRFITYDLGAETTIEQKRSTYAACLGIHVWIALILILLGETVGLWIFHNYTVIPAERLVAAKIIYQLALFTFSIQMLSVPYSAAIIAHERMSVYAVISIMEAVLRLIGVMIIPFIPGDALILYGVIVALVALVSSSMNMGYVLSKMQEYRTRPSWEKGLSTRILAFSGWTMLGSATNTGTQQGVALLFNNFVSLIANAALGFANQVNAALAQFVNSFTTAFNPQVIKLCAAQDYDALHRLMTMASKISFVLAYIMALPLIVNMDYLLHLWLGNVPQYTTEFCQLILVCTVIDATTGVYNTAITATGQIRNYQIAISLSFTLDLLLAFLLLKAQIHPALVFGSRILTRGFINMGIGLYYTRSLIAFDIKRYTLQALVPIMLVLLITIPVNYGLRLCFDALPLLIISTAVDCILIIVLGYLIVLNSSERTAVKNTIKQKLHVA